MGGGDKIIMTTIDKRVVDMQFNNNQFEQGIRTSIKSLEALKKGLNLNESIKSLNNLDKVAKSFSLAEISQGVDYISNKFTTLGIVGITTIQNLTNSAIAFGKRIISALTFDPITTGFTEYETKMNSIQTILTNTASKGTTIHDVNKALNELNEYSDKTIYNFAQMTDNIGKFTAAGLGLEESVTVVKGMANVAAGFGVDAARMAGATYQMSQALSAGAVKLIDWKSMEMASMGGEMLQKTLRDTAKEMGIYVDANKPFRETLENGWLTTKVFVKAMEKMAEDESLVAAAQNVTTFTKLFDTMKESVQSGWAQTWENIIGDKNESTKFLTSISKGFDSIVGASADARNETLRFWKDNGGRDALINSLTNSFEALLAVLKPIGEAFREIFPSVTGGDLIGLTKRFKEFTDGLKIGDETAKNIKDTFKGLFALLDIGKMAIGALIKSVFSLIKILFPVTDSFLSITGGIGNFIVAIRDALKSSDSFNVVMTNIARVLKPIVEGIVMFADLIASAFKAVRSPDLTGIEEFTEKMEERFQPLIKVGEAIKSFLSFFYNLATAIGNAFGALSDSIIKSINTSDFQGLFDIINTGLLGTVLYGTKKFIDSLTKIADSAGGLLSGITGIFDGVRDCLAAYQSQLKANVLLKIAISIGILAAALMTISMIDSQKLTVSLAAMTTMFIELFGAMAVFNTLAGVKGIFAMTALSTGMIGLSIAILTLTKALKSIASLDWGGMLKGLLGVAGLTGILIGATKLLETSSKSLIISSIGFIIFGGAILVLTQSIKRLGELDLGNLTKGLIGVGILMAELVLFMKYANFSGMGVISSTGILILASAIIILAGAVKKISSINLTDLIKGLTGIAVLLTTISIFIKSAGNAKNVISTAVSLTILGVALNILGAAIIKMGNMSWEGMAKGLLTLGGALGAITIAFMALPKGIFIQSLALLDVAGAIMLLSAALKALGELSWPEIARALTTMFLSLGVIIAAFVLLGKTSSLADSLAFSILAISINILADALKTLGSMSLPQMGVAILGLAAAFGVIGAAAILLTPTIPAILGLAVAVGVLGVSVAAIGTGILALSAGLTALAAAGTAGSVALVALITSIVGLIPYVAKTLAQGVIEFAKIIGEGVPIIADAMNKVISAILDVLVNITPKLVDTVLNLLTKLLESLLKYMPHIVEVGIQLVVALLKGIATNIKDVIRAGVDLVLNFIAGIAERISDIIQSGFELMVAFINGLAIAIDKNAEVVINAIKNLIVSILKTAYRLLINAISKFKEIGSEIVQGLIQGIKDKIASIIEGIKDLTSAAIKAARDVLDSHSPSEKFKEIGEDIGLGLSLGIDKSTPKVENSSKKMTEKAVTASQKAAKKVAKEAEKAAREAFNASASWIDERKYYNELSLYEELDAWERVQARYLEGIEERKKADREVYRVKQQITKADMDFAQQVIDTTREATRKKIEYEQEYYDKCQEINDRLKNDIQSLNDKYNDALESRTKTLYDTYGLFDKVEPKEPVSGKELIKNLQDQVTEFDTWTRVMADLSRKGIDEALIKELQEMGPRSLKQIEALNELSQPELNEYVLLWQRKSSQAKEVAIEELRDLRIETQNEIKRLNAQAIIDLEEQRRIFDEKTKALAEETITTIEEMKKDWLKQIGELRTKGEKDFKTFAKNIVTIMGTPDWIGVGQDIVNGMASGVRSKASELADAAVSAALDALEAAKEALGMSSPSKKFAELGKYSSIGFAEGLKKFTSLVTSSASDLGESSIFALKKAISNISNMIHDNIDTELVIRPVLDLTDIKSGSLLIDDLLTQTKGIDVSNVKKRLPVFTKAETTGEINDAKTVKETKVSFIQNNYSPKALSRLEIYRQTRNQISALRGVVSI
jgi:tape measure domain-containing protein